MDTASENTEVQTEQSAPVTDTENVELTKSETTEPKLERKDGKMYVEGVGRVYTLEMILTRLPLTQRTRQLMACYES